MLTWIQLTPQLLKAGVTAALLEMMAPIQADFQASKEWQDTEKKAYTPPEVKNKEKKAKDKGSRHPGSTAAKPAVESKPDGHVEGEGKDKTNLASGAEEAMQYVNAQKSLNNP